MPNTLECEVQNSAVGALEALETADRHLHTRYQDRMATDPSLNRQLVSFQANKTRPAYRWYKYKEAFSAALVETLLQRVQIRSGALLDPFAGSGTALFAGSEAGLDADGIELLPIGDRIIHARQILERELSETERQRLRYWSAERPWKKATETSPLPELRITRGAYPAGTAKAIEGYLNAVRQESPRVEAALEFALLSILESVSYTRKDGQYLRWDHRSGRRVGARPFNKGPIAEFDAALHEKLEEMIADTSSPSHLPGLFDASPTIGTIQGHSGSCLTLLPTFPTNTYEVIVTSPPYCNRYDYTRTYALELALLGIDEAGLSRLRQEMLSCTVENRAKALTSMNPDWRHPVECADRHELLQRVVEYLERQKSQGALNNNGIPRMVRNYFYEMACVLHECHRTLKPGAVMIMVNDNVKYAGASIAVDLILSSLAEALGFQVERILTLPNAKGNSSQQMGAHGREPLRKSVYMWRKPR